MVVIGLLCHVHKEPSSTSCWWLGHCSCQDPATLSSCSNVYTYIEISIYIYACIYIYKYIYIYIYKYIHIFLQIHMYIHTYINIIYIYTYIKNIYKIFVFENMNQIHQILCEQIARQSWWAQQYTCKLLSNASPSIGLQGSMLMSMLRHSTMWCFHWQVAWKTSRRMKH